MRMRRPPIRVRMPSVSTEWPITIRLAPYFFRTASNGFATSDSSSNARSRVHRGPDGLPARPVLSPLASSSRTALLISAIERPAAVEEMPAWTNTRSLIFTIVLCVRIHFPYFPAGPIALR